jgi:hypothetical protein
MNIDVNSVIQVAASPVSRAVHASAPAPGRGHCSPGCVISYGIDPYSSTFSM